MGQERGESLERELMADCEQMSARQFKAIRKRADLTQSGLARVLRISDLRTIRRYETGERAISGPVSLLMELLDAGDLPID